MTSVAFHVDQLFSPAPGGIGTYVRNLLPALARQDPSVDLRPFHARSATGPSATDEVLLRRMGAVELPGTIKSLYPRWNLTGRPPLPAPLGDADLVHAASAVAVPPAGDGQKLVVTVHDLAFLAVPSYFPRQWRQVYRTGLRATIRRADAIVTPSRSTAEDLLSRTKVDPSRVHVIPEAAALPPSQADPDTGPGPPEDPRPYSCRSAPWNRGRTLSGWSGPTAGCDDRRPPRAGAGRAAGVAPPGAAARAGAGRPRRHRADREGHLGRHRRAVPPGRPVRVPRGLRGVRPARPRGHGPGRSHRARTRPHCPRWPATRRSAFIPVRSGRSRRGCSGCSTTRTGRTPPRGRAGRAERFSWDETARLTLQVYEKALGR